MIKDNTNSAFTQNKPQNIKVYNVITKYTTSIIKSTRNYASC